MHEVVLDSRLCLQLRGGKFKEVTPDGFRAMRCSAYSTSNVCTRNFVHVKGTYFFLCSYARWGMCNDGKLIVAFVEVDVELILHSLSLKFQLKMLFL